MTRKEIEKRCLEEMQQTIPDTEALWQRIESQLPQQEEAAKQSPQSIRMQHIYRILPIAACLLLTISGAAVFLQQDNRIQQESSNTVSMNENANEHFDAEDYMPPIKNEQVQDFEEENTAKFRSYASLNFGKGEQKNHITNPALLGTENEYFHEADVLKRTECFVIAVAEYGNQDPETGDITYQLRVQKTYGSELLQDDLLIIRSKSSYILQPGHEYILPLYKEQDEWKISFECAPQMEFTLNGEVVFHNGWQSLDALESERISCSPSGTHDYFYDRMYITRENVPELLIAAWENVRSV